MKIKICGIKRLEDIKALNALQPDYIGFVFAKSKRQIDKVLAKKLRQRLNPSIKTVGVFVNAPLPEIESYISQKIIDCVQLHGNESESDIIHIKTKFPQVTVFKAISVNCSEDILMWQHSQADFLLLDNGAGGTGKAFDWELLNELDAMQKPYFIAGGLTPHNVKDVLRFKAFGVDVSGGVESNGEKETTKIKEFIENVRKNYE